MTTTSMQNPGGLAADWVVVTAIRLSELVSVGPPNAPTIPRRSSAQMRPEVTSSGPAHQETKTYTILLFSLDPIRSTKRPLCPSEVSSWQPFRRLLPSLPSCVTRPPSPVSAEADRILRFEASYLAVSCAFLGYSCVGGLLVDCGGFTYQRRTSPLDGSQDEVGSVALFTRRFSALAEHGGPHPS